jgi:hypothetical protein
MTHSSLNLSSQSSSIWPSSLCREIGISQLWSCLPLWALGTLRRNLSEILESYPDHLHRVQKMHSGGLYKTCLFIRTLPLFAMSPTHPALKQRTIAPVTDLAI